MLTHDEPTMETRNENSATNDFPLPIPEVCRMAVVLHSRLEGGAIASVAATVTGGLRSESFEAPILDTDGNAHAGIKWSLVALKAKTTGQLLSLLSAARERSVHAVAFSRFGQDLNNQFAHYTEQIKRSRTQDLDVVAVGLFGKDTDVRELTRSFSLLR